jgi:hypothetical protein
LNRQDLPARDIDAHILLGRRTGAIDEAHVIENQHGGIFFDVGRKRGGMRLRDC